MWPEGKSRAAICVQNVDVRVLQFTRKHAVCCVLHRPTSRVIHRSGCLHNIDRTFPLSSHRLSEGTRHRRTATRRLQAIPGTPARRGPKPRIAERQLGNWSTGSHSILRDSRATSASSCKTGMHLPALGGHAHRNVRPAHKISRFLDDTCALPFPAITSIESLRTTFAVDCSQHAQ